MADERTIPSPCIKVCVLDPESGLCRGCLRTAEEIGGWRDAGAAERLRILERIRRRRHSTSAGAATTVAAIDDDRH